MYTDDDKYNKNKHNFSSNNQGKSNDEDYYKDYYKEYSSPSQSEFSYNNSSSVNDLDTSYSDDYSDNTGYQLDSRTVSKKKYIVIILLLFIVLCVLIVILFKTLTVKVPPTKETSNYVHLFYEELELHVGATQKLELTLSENSDDNYKIDWFSSNDDVVSVDNNGNIKALAKGEAIIMVAYYVDDMIYDTQCHIYVLD